jgi:peptide/nickel transport system permease protein
MLGFLSRRLLVAVPTILGVATLVFVMIHAIPGDPVDAMLGESAAPAARTELRERLGLDRPMVAQYLSFIGGLARGDMGRSIQSGEPVASLVCAHLPMTVALAATALAFAMALALPLGLLAAARAGGMLDRFCLTTSLLGVSMPNFWLGPMLVLGFSLHLGWLPVSGSASPAYIVLPAMTLGLSLAGILTRMTRSTVLDVLGEDFIRTARATGYSEQRILARDALANALTPLATIVGLQSGALLAGSVITETIFAWPGIGRLTVDAIRMRDYPLVQGCVLAISLSYVLVNLATDVVTVWADPRTRDEHGD